MTAASASSALLTDLYQLSMLEAYVDAGMQETAVFELFIRKLPPGRRFLMAAGLEQALEYLETLHFSEEELRWLEHRRCSPALLGYLRDFRFTGDVDAMPEGTIFFPNEPILRVTAPLPQAQFVETRLMNLVHFQTLVASKAARCVLAAQSRTLIDFGLRRAHGAEAGLLAARASYVAGFTGTATVLANMRFGVPAFGTMAHSFVQAHDREMDAFERFAHAHPDNVILLLDTYDTEAAARLVVTLAPRLRSNHVAIRGVRLDSGNLGDHARRVRRILDDGGLADARIVASGNLDEWELERLVAGGAPIDTFAVGTALTTSSDRPYLDCAYKLQEYAGRSRRKRSEGKATWPGRKQVFRSYDATGRIAGDLLTILGDAQPGRTLLEPVMREGLRVAQPRTLRDIRTYAAAELQSLPAPLRALGEGPEFEVAISPALRALAADVDTAHQTAATHRVDL
jgi:nicotinate phosphoribosyltransferase